MKIFSMRPSFHGYSSSSIVSWYYQRAWNTMHGAKRAIVARTVDLYTAEISKQYRTVKFNLPDNPDDGDQFLESNKKNIRIFDAGVCEILKQKLFPEKIIPHTEEQLDELLVETNTSYTDAVNECVRIFRNGLGDDTDEELEILESKLLSAREMLDKNVGAIEHELMRRKVK